MSSAAAAVDSAKGRGARDMEDDGRYAGESGVFETIGDGDTGPAKCKWNAERGWGGTGAGAGAKALVYLTPTFCLPLLPSLPKPAFIQ